MKSDINMRFISRKKLSICQCCLYLVIVTEIQNKTLFLIHRKNSNKYWRRNLRFVSLVK